MKPFSSAVSSPPTPSTPSTLTSNIISTSIPTPNVHSISSYSYHSPSRIKTLDLLATNKLLKDHSYETLVRYCYLARGQGCQNFNEIKEFFLQRYQWNILQREEEFQRAWKETQIENFSNEEQNPLVENNLHDSNEKRVYISLKKDSFSRSSLLCQIHDSQLQFVGDTGAIGRLTTDEINKRITIDLKGRQYSGKLYPGPTVMFLNMSQPPRSNSNSQTILKVETITNEYCPLVFEKDLLADLMGAYSGEGIETIRSEQLEGDEEGKIDEDDSMKNKKNKNNGGGTKKRTKSKSENVEKPEGEKKKRKRVSKKEDLQVESEEEESEIITKKPTRKKSISHPLTSSQKNVKKKSKGKNSEIFSDENESLNLTESNNDEDIDEEDDEEDENEDDDSDFSQPKRKSITSKKKLLGSSNNRNPKISTQRVRTKVNKKKKNSKLSKK